MCYPTLKVLQSVWREELALKPNNTNYTASETFRGLLLDQSSTIQPVRTIECAKFIDLIANWVL